MRRVRQDQQLRVRQPAPEFDGLGYRHEVVVTGEPRELSVEAGQTLIRAAQEALTNARRHAVGAALDVSLHYRETAVEWARKIAVSCRCSQELREFMYDPQS